MLVTMFALSRSEAAALALLVIVTHYILLTVAAVVSYLVLKRIEKAD